MVEALSVGEARSERMAITVTVNGKKRELAEGTTVTAFLSDSKVRVETVAVEINGELVMRSDYDGHELQDGDSLEYLHYMAGGALCGPRRLLGGRSK